MKILMTVLGLAVTLWAHGQTNGSQELDDLRRLARERALILNEYLNQVTLEAQAIAVSNRNARPRPLITPPPLIVLRTNRPPLIDTNGQVPIQALEIMERMIPGSTTNVRPYQLYDPYTNAASLRAMEWFRTNRALPGEIRSTDTNYLQKLREWREDQFRLEESKRPSGGGDINGWTNKGVDSWSLEFLPQEWADDPGFPYIEPGTTNITNARLKPTVGLEYPTDYGTNRIQRQTNSLAAMTCPDFQGAFGAMEVRYPELCWLNDFEWFACATGHLYGVKSGSLEPYDVKDRAKMSGGYIRGLWLWTASISTGGSVDFRFVYSQLYPPEKATFFAPPFLQGPMIEPPSVPREWGLPFQVHIFGPAGGWQQLESSLDGLAWTFITNGPTDVDGVLTVEVPSTNAAMFFRSANTPAP